jgi:hypothetical protein
MIAMLLPSAEIRWFFQGTLSDEILNWFSPPEQERNLESEREDQYLLLPECDTVGVKLREGKLEVKALISGPSRFTLGNIVGRTDQWIKWSFDNKGLQALKDDLLESGKWKEVQKERILRKFSTDSGVVREVSPKQKPFPVSGCNVELTSIKVNAGQKWFSLGFEAFGPAAINERLEKVVRSFFEGNGDMPGIPLSEIESLNYPTWIRKL